MNRFCLIALLALGACALTSENAAAQRVPPKGLPNGGPMGMGAQQYEMAVVPDVKVRLLHPPPEFDDKGKLKKYTAEELKKLKGDDDAERKLAGIKSSFDVLKPGDVVQVSFSRPKDPKDLENTTFTPIAGQMVGTVVNVDAGASKALSILFSPNGVPPMAQGRGGKRGGPQANPNAKEIVIKPEQRQASVIVIVEQAPEPEARPQGGAKRKK